MDISAVPAVIATTKADGANLVFGGTGPAGGRYTVLKSTAAAQPAAQWTPVATNYFGADGAFFITNSLSPSLPQMYYLLRVP
jgi:hypothetical protein